MGPTRITSTPTRLGTALTLAGTVLAVAGGPTAQASVPDALTTATISSPELAVEVDADFPSVVRYVDPVSGATIGGRPGAVRSLLLNGVSYEADVASTVDADSASYELTFPALPGVRVDAELQVAGKVLTFRVTEVADSATYTVNTLEIPGQDLLSVDSSQPGAAAATTRIDVDSTRNADDIRAITDATPTGAASGASYAILSTDKLAATIETNGSYDKPTTAQGKEAARFWQQVSASEGGHKRLGVRSGQWTVRGEGASKQSELPWAKVVLTGEVNRDGRVDWQDGAVAFRSIGQVPAGAERTADRVIEHIPFNFASLATHPFLRTLDDVKRLSRATDGLGQLAILKGYGSEGHDSAHPDYGGNYNERAGGLPDLNRLLEQGEKWNADFGVHVNATESYPEAKAFDEILVDKSAKGWNWLNQSYYINQRRDLVSGDLIRRFQQLRDETHRNLELLYVDVYYTYGWIPDEMNRQLREMGWQVGTEWADHMERNSVWSHWATDRGYGGATNKGINSTIIRFIRNGQKDVWNPHPILGSSTIVEAEGWTGQNDWTALMRNVWTNQLPTKFLQHFDITRWSPQEIAFTGGVRGTTDDVRGTSTAGVRRLYVADAEVLRGGTYLLPWGEESPLRPNRAYHYNPDGGTTTWTLPPALRGVRSFTMYALSDTGRTKVGTIAVTSGKVTLTATPGVAYVLHPGQAPTPVAAAYGEGSGLVDPGFNGTDLAAWHPQGDVSVVTTDRGWRVARLGTGQASISQPITGLTPGRTYAASAWVEVQPGRRRTTSVGVTGLVGGDVSRVVDRSTLRNVVASDEKVGTWFQRVRVIFTASGTPRLVVAADDGTGEVRVDDVRVVETTEAAPSGDVVAAQDFEDVDQGWLPFVAGPAQSGGDGRTHVTSRHAPYTQAGWNGKLVDDVLGGEWSLKAHEQGTGVIYRTHQGSLDLEAGRSYRVEFDYESAYAASHAWVVGVDIPTATGADSHELTATPLPQRRTRGHFSTEVTAVGCGSTWIGLKGLPAGGSQDDFILDDLVVTDLGPADVPAGCAREEITGLGSGLVPGEVNRVTTKFTNLEAAAASGVRQSLAVPEGWTAVPVTSPLTATVAPGASASTAWDLTVPSGTAPGAFDLTAAAAYTIDGEARSVQGVATATTLPAGLIPQSRLAIHRVSDAEPGTGDGSAYAAIDGNPATMWHSAWSQVNPDTPYPHWISLDLGGNYEVDGLDYQVRVGNGSIKAYEVYVSADGVSWGAPVRTGSFASTTSVQHLDLPVTTGRYVKLVGLSSINGAVFAGAGELNVWGRLVAQPTPLPKAGMSIASVDSEETVGEDGAAANVLDGDASSFWHTEWLDAETPYPHQVTVDLGATHSLVGVLHTGRPGTEQNGRIKGYQVLLSTDGTTWGTPVASGELTSASAPQRISFPARQARYVRFVGLSSHNGAAFASIAELDFLRS